MYSRLKKREGGFTLIEIMVSMTILTLALGSIYQVFGVGTRLMNKQSNQLDYRSSARRIITYMEEDVQKANTIELDNTASYSEVILDKGTSKERNYRYQDNIITQNIHSPSSSKVIAKDVTSAVFSNAADHPNPNNTIPELKLELGFSRSGVNPETMKFNAIMSPRWNVGRNAPYIISFKQGADSNLLVGSSVYDNIVIKGVNTNFASNSIVRLYRKGVLYASSKGTTPTVSGDHLTLSNITLKHVIEDNLGNEIIQTSMLPLGKYDVDIVTPMVGYSEEVFKNGMTSVVWDRSFWSTGHGWDTRVQPLVINNGNSNNSPIYCTIPTAVNVNTFIIEADITDLQRGAAYRMGETTGEGADADIAMGISMNGSGSSYIGFGINAKYVFLRQVHNQGAGDTPVPGVYLMDSSNRAVEIDRNATLRAEAVAGVLSLYFNGHLIDGTNYKWSTPTTYTVPTGRIGFQALSRAAPEFNVIEFWWN